MRAPILLAATIAAAAGCASDASTGPSPRSLAVHFDSLWQSAVETNDQLRQIAMQYIAIPLAFGVSPHEVSITVDGKAAKYQAVAYEFVDVTIAGVAVDSSYNFAAWADANANKVIITEYLPAEQGFALGYLDGGTEGVGQHGTIADTVISAAGNCSALDLSSVYFEASYSTCSHSVQSTSFDVQVTQYQNVGTGGGPQVNEVKLGSVRLPAVRLYQHY
jgi:hypothetical protein